ncbi:hypothetical protein [Rhizobium changzhiense]|uniref:Uncharacterized protein n=1 Tax=Rhizobium changzhiense TaxID=2692317 RepID=A0ABR6ADA2_9HYPH|nr:hypothetical protein [Rhizobium changzhiense]MBA5804582.1 hypothetical protein [Rhizobium changzhiense]
MPATLPDSLNRNRFKESGSNSKCYSVLCASKKTRGAVVGAAKSSDEIAIILDLPSHAGQLHAGVRQSIPVPVAPKREEQI